MLQGANSRIYRQRVDGLFSNEAFDLQAGHAIIVKQHIAAAPNIHRGKNGMQGVSYAVDHLARSAAAEHELTGETGHGSFKVRDHQLARAILGHAVGGYAFHAGDPMVELDGVFFDLQQKVSKFAVLFLLALNPAVQTRPKPLRLFRRPQAEVICTYRVLLQHACEGERAHWGATSAGGAQPCQAAQHADRSDRGSVQLCPADMGGRRRKRMMRPYPVIDPKATGENILRCRLEKGYTVLDVQQYLLPK